MARESLISPMRFGRKNHTFLSGEVHSSDFKSMAEVTPMSDSIQSAIEIRKFKMAVKDFNDFKRLREEMGKPLRTSNNRDLFINDLDADSIPSVKDRERKRNSVTRRSRNY